MRTAAMYAIGRSTDFQERGALLKSPHTETAERERQEHAART